MENQNEIGYISIDCENIDTDAVKLIPQNYAQKHCIICFKTYCDKACIAVKKCGNINKICEELKFITHKNIRLFYCEEKEILRAINNYYCKYNAEEALNLIKKQKDILIQNKSECSIRTQESPAVALLNSIISSAIYKGSSDIHIEPFEDHVAVRYRVDGSLVKIANLPYSIYPSLCVRIKIISKMDITEKRMPQDGSGEFNLNGKKFDLRISTLPVLYGEKIVIRILYKSKQFSHLDSLGFEYEGISNIRDMLKSSHGIILVTGPTGSGKSTTLYAMLSEIKSNEKNIVTIEDPVEYMIPGISQVSVNKKAGITFANGLKNLLRQDPDVIMIGEIRDEETAKIAVRAAITGHLVLSTLHTNDSGGAIARLIDMGIPRYLLADALIGVISQRLVRMICNNCKAEYDEHDNMKIIGKGGTSYKGKGCEKCSFTGYRGRTVIYEIMNIGSELKKMILESRSGTELQNFYYKDLNMPLEEYGMSLAKKGITTSEEVLKATYIKEQP